MNEIDELRRRVSHLEIGMGVIGIFTMIVLAFAASHPKVIAADRVVAHEIVIVNDKGEKVGHFGTTPDRPGEVVLILKDNPEHMIALNVAHDFSGAIVKSGTDEQIITASDKR